MVYDIAGLRIDIRNKYDFTDKFCREYLSCNQDAPVDIVACVSDEEIQSELQLNKGFSIGYIENYCLYSNICRQIPLKDRVLLHAAILEYNGNAYAFLGRSGTGKSTHTGLWLKSIPGAKILNGDKPILHCTEDGIIVYGTPWMGKEALGYKGSAPLKGLCFLEQSLQNEIKQLSLKEGAARLFPQILNPIEEKAAARTLEIADTLLCKTPAYLLRCDISLDAVKLSFEALTGERFSSTERSGNED